MTAGARPAWSIEAFVRARREFVDGLGSTAAWQRLNAISLWRLDGLAEQAGSRTWALLVNPPGALPSRTHVALLQTLRSAQVAASVLPAFWRFGDGRISTTRVVAAHHLALRQAVRLVQRYGHLTAAHVQRIPFERVVVYDSAAERSIEVGVFDPALIAQCLAQSVGATDAVVMYRCATMTECLAMTLAERRLSNDPLGDATGEA